MTSGGLPGAGCLAAGHQPRLALGSSASCPWQEGGVPWASYPTSGRPDLPGWVMCPLRTAPPHLLTKSLGFEASLCNLSAS